MFNFFSKRREPQQLFFSTDIHCHILPGIDDGSPDTATSMDLIGRMQQWGIKRIFASPHVTYGSFPNTPETIADSLAELKGSLAAAGNDIFLSNSAENRIDDLLMQNLEKGTVLTLPGKRILIENAFMQEPWNLDRLIFDLQVQGFSPILVHPERYSYYYAKKDRYDSLHASGAAFQINLLSLAGYYGRDEKRYAEYLTDRGLVDYIGSDLHHKAHAEAIDAYLSSKDYLRHRDKLQGRIGNDSI
ncbi:MAG: hypothetical protein K2L77_05395 [Muribaculaceae bacterium]|nr:hypothetical protein [Muribaculaceae bacterium]